MIFAEITKRNYMSVSVTLKSYFYEVLIPSSQKNTSSPIEDILHHVSISFMKKLALYKCFNPRTHTGCDTSPLAGATFSVVLCFERYSCFYPLCSACCFCSAISSSPLFFSPGILFASNGNTSINWVSVTEAMV